MNIRCLIFGKTNGPSGSRRPWLLCAAHAFVNHKLYVLHLCDHRDRWDPNYSKVLLVLQSYDDFSNFPSAVVSYGLYMKDEVQALHIVFIVLQSFDNFLQISNATINFCGCQPKFPAWKGKKKEKKIKIYPTLWMSPWDSMVETLHRQNDSINLTMTTL